MFQGACLCAERIQNPAHATLSADALLVIAQWRGRPDAALHVVHDVCVPAGRIADHSMMPAVEEVRAAGLTDVVWDGHVLTDAGKPCLRPSRPSTATTPRCACRPHRHGSPAEACRIHRGMPSLPHRRRPRCRRFAPNSACACLWGQNGPPSSWPTLLPVAILTARSSSTARKPTPPPPLLTPPSAGEWRSRQRSIPFDAPPTPRPHQTSRSSVACRQRSFLGDESDMLLLTTWASHAANS